MEPSSEPVSGETGQAREGVVGNEKASKQGLPRAGYGMNWTEILGRAGLESPGYHEVIKKMKEEGRIRQSR